MAYDIYQFLREQDDDVIHGLKWATVVTPDQRYQVHAEALTRMIRSLLEGELNMRALMRSNRPARWIK